MRELCELGGVHFVFIVVCLMWCELGSYFAIELIAHVCHSNLNKKYQCYLCQLFHRIFIVANRRYYLFADLSRHYLKHLSTVGRYLLGVPRVRCGAGMVGMCMRVVMVKLTSYSTCSLYQSSTEESKPSLLAWSLVKTYLIQNRMPS